MTNIPTEERRKFVGASEVAALFGLHPQLTKFELWHIKKGNIPAPDLDGNDPVFWGTTLEPAIARGIAAKKKWHIRKVNRYSLNPNVPGMGASLDYEIVGHEHGPAPFEIKNVSSLVARNWPEDQPPIHFDLQVQTQLACQPSRRWGAIGAL
ncbi:MAG: YqaJ viral recombinase family protein, partial [Sneathiella sp.]